MAARSPSQYLISLCTSAQGSGETFGMATRIGSSNSRFNIETTKVIHSIVTFSPAPDAIAAEFLLRLNHVKNISFLVEPVLDGMCSVDYAAWAKEVLDFLSANFTPIERSTVIKPITDLASEMLTYLLIATRNPGGKKTPQDSEDHVHDSNDNMLPTVPELLHEATAEQSQSALKELLLWRDGSLCPLTGAPFESSESYVIPRCAHILPFSFQNKPLTLKALEMFAGRQLSQEVMDSINHPLNAFNVQIDAHYAYERLAWGLEARAEFPEEVISNTDYRRDASNTQTDARDAFGNLICCRETVQADNKWKYFYRVVRPGSSAWTIKLKDGDKVLFHRGAPKGQAIDGPNPEYCNLRLALARASYACGVADIIREAYGDDDGDAIVGQPVYFGGPYISDDVLLCRLDDRLLP